MNEESEECLIGYRKKLFEKLTCPPQPQSIQDVEDRFILLFPTDQPSALRDSALKEARHRLDDGPRTTLKKSSHHSSSSVAQLIAEKFRVLVMKERPDNDADRFREALLNYIIKDLYELSRKYVSNLKRDTITREDINIVVYAFEDMSRLFKSDLGINSHNNKSHKQIIEQMVSAEKSFLRVLQLIMKVFRDKLYASILSNQEIDAIFSNITEVYELSASLLASLEDAMEDTEGDEPPYIGSSIFELAEGNKFESYCTYASGILSPEWHLSFSKMLKNTDLSCSQIHSFGLLVEYVLPKLLLGVVFHFFEYFQYIKDLEQQSSQPGNDKFKSENDKFKNTLSILLSTKSKLEVTLAQNKIDIKAAKPWETYLRSTLPSTLNQTLIQTIEKLKKSVEHWDIEYECSIKQYCKEFILEGDLIKTKGGQKRSHRHVFLFDNLLFFSKKNPKRAPSNLGTQFEYKMKDGPIQLKDIEIVDWSTDNLKFNHSPFEFVDGTAPNQAFNFHSPSFSSMTISNGTSTSSGSILSTSLSSSYFSNTLPHSSPVLGSLPSPELSMQFMQNCDHGVYAFRLQRNTKDKRDSSCILFAKSAEEKSMWLSNLLLLSNRKTLENYLDIILKTEKACLPLPPPTIYRFTEPDSEHNIILEKEEKREEKKKEQTPSQIRCATLLKLVERVTFHEFPDPNLVRIFLLTYRSFISHPSELLDLLIERFNIPEPYPVYLDQGSEHDSSKKITLEFCWHVGENLSTSSVVDMRSERNVGMHTHPRCKKATYKNQKFSKNDNDNYINPLVETPEHIETAYKEALRRFRDDYSNPVQLRVMNVLRSWSKDHFYDFERYPSLLDRLRSFLEEAHRDHPRKRKFIESIHNVIAKNQKPAEPEKIRLHQTVIPPEIEWHTAQANEPDKFDILTLHPREIARQITLIGFDLFRSIKQSELINTRELTGERTIDEEKYESSPNKSKFESHFNKISYWIRKCIIEAEDFDHRVVIMQRAIEIMKVFYELNNFAGLISVGGAIECSSVKRLEYHFKALRSRQGQDYNKEIDKYNELFDKGHFKGLHQRLKEIGHLPCVPFLGYYQTQLIHTIEGNRTFVDENSQIRNSIGERNSSSGETSCVSAPVSPQSLSTRTNNGLSETELFPTSASLEDFDSRAARNSNNLDSIDAVKRESQQNSVNKLATMKRPKMINFIKQRLRTTITEEIRAYQNNPYCLQVQPEIRDYIESIEVYPKDMSRRDFKNDKELYDYIDDFLYRKSLKIEPRDCKQLPRDVQRKRPEPKCWKSPMNTKSRRSYPTPLPTLSDRIPSAHQSPSTPLTPQSPPLSGGSAVSSEHSVFASAFASPTLFGSIFEGSVSTISTTTSVGTIIENSNGHPNEFTQSKLPPPPPVPPRGRNIISSICSDELPTSTLPLPPKPRRAPPLPPAIIVESRHSKDTLNRGYQK